MMKNKEIKSLSDLPIIGVPTLPKEFVFPIIEETVRTFAEIFKEYKETELIETRKREAIEKISEINIRKIELVESVLLEDMQKNHEKNIKKIEETFSIVKLLIEKGKTEDLDKILILCLSDTDNISKNTLELIQSILSPMDENYIDIEPIEE